MNTTAGLPLWQGFLSSAARFPERAAIEVGGQPHSYADLLRVARRRAATFEADPAGAPPFTAVYANRSYTAYAGILAAMLRGHAYVPLNPDFPVSRLAEMIEIAGCRSVIVDPATTTKFLALLDTIDTPLQILAPGHDRAGHAFDAATAHRVHYRDDLAEPAAWRRPVTAGSDLAYVLFTSGTTGKPKGVGVTHDNIRALLTSMLAIYRVDETDRWSQFADLTFDASVHDIFYAWETGGCVCCPSFRQLTDRGRFIRTARLTVFTSAPSFASAMRQRGELVPGCFPDLRLTVFGADGLPVELAKAWQAAAPNGRLFNCYGPTELTVNAFSYEWRGAASERDAELGFVPIGYPLDDMIAVVVDDDLNEVPPGERGELLMSGPQCTPGYLNTAQKTAQAYVRLRGRDGTFYRTGDLVRRPPTPDAPYVMLGRIDNQAQIGGARVELGEIESVVRELTHIDAVIALPWPVIDGVATGIELFIETADLDRDGLMARLKTRLAPFAVPKRIHRLDAMPLNANGKYDRLALRARLAAPPKP